MSNEIYIENGYQDRDEYLTCLSEDYDVSLEDVVKPLADMLGPDEDFDELVAQLEYMSIC